MLQKTAYSMGDDQRNISETPFWESVKNDGLTHRQKNWVGVKGTKGKRTNVTNLTNYDGKSHTRNSWMTRASKNQHPHTPDEKTEKGRIARETMGRRLE